MCVCLLLALAKFGKSAGQFSAELRAELDDAGCATQKAFANLRRLVYMETGDGAPTVAMPHVTSSVEGASGGDHELFGNKKDRDSKAALSSDVLIMQPIFRFFQLLCENHNLELQVAGQLRCSVLENLRVQSVCRT